MFVRSPIGWVAIGLFAVAPALAQEQASPKAEAPKAALKNLVVYPAKIQLDGPRDEQQLGVLGEFADGRGWDRSRTAALTSSNPKVAIVEQGVVRPVSDGDATITVVALGQSKSVPVKVVKANVDKPVEFTREIVPI